MAHRLLPETPVPAPAPGAGGRPATIDRTAVPAAGWRSAMAHLLAFWLLLMIPVGAMPRRRKKPGLSPDAPARNREDALDLGRTKLWPWALDNLGLHSSTRRSGHAQTSDAWAGPTSLAYPGVSDLRPPDGCASAICRQYSAPTTPPQAVGDSMPRWGGVLKFRS